MGGYLRKSMWGGHSLRLRSGQALSADFEVGLFLKLRAEVKTKVKSDGQECPSHMT